MVESQTGRESQVHDCRHWLTDDGAEVFVCTLSRSTAVRLDELKPTENQENTDD